MKNLIIGAISGNYSPQDLTNWVETSNWDNCDRVLLLYNPSNNGLEEYLKNNNINIIYPNFDFWGNEKSIFNYNTGECDFTTSYDLIHNIRFFHIYNFLQNNVYNKVLITDVKDVYFNNEHYRSLQQDKIVIKPKTLTEIIQSTYITHIDFLSLDVEGHEYEVLQSWDFSIPIDIILIEMLAVEPNKDQLCRDILIKNNYQFISICGCNEIYAHPNYNRDSISI
jgi:hypothetical protein